MQTIQWEVAAADMPRAIRHCKKCHKKTEYLCSGRFRINAQQRDLDIWLIYRCAICDCTWNLTVFSRIGRQSVDGRLLERLHQNDRELATSYACDLALLKRHGAEVALPEYTVNGEEFDRSAYARIHIKNSYPAAVRLAGVLREKLGLSSSALKRLVEGGSITGPAGYDLLKYKLKDSVEIEIMPL